MAIVCGSEYRQSLKDFANELHSIAGCRNKSTREAQPSVKAIAVLLDKLADMETPFCSIDDFCEHLIDVTQEVESLTEEGLCVGKGLVCHSCGVKFGGKDEIFHARYKSDCALQGRVIICRACAEKGKFNDQKYASRAMVDAIVALADDRSGEAQTEPKSKQD